MEISGNYTLHLHFTLHFTDRSDQSQRADTCDKVRQTTPAAETDRWWRKASWTAELVQRRPKKSIAFITPATYFTLLPRIATLEQARRMVAVSSLTAARW